MPIYVNGNQVGSDSNVLGNNWEAVLVNGNDTFASQITIDDFEQYNGTTLSSTYSTNTGSGSRSVISSAALSSGSTQGLYIDGPSIMVSMPGDGLENYFQPNNTSVWYANAQSSDNWNFALGQQQSTNTMNGAEGYWLEYQFGSGARLVYRDGSRNVFGTENSSSLNTNQTYRVEWSISSGGYHEVYFRTLGGSTAAYLDGNDSRFISSTMAVGYWGSGGANVYIDNHHIDPSL